MLVHHPDKTRHRSFRTQLLLSALVLATLMVLASGWIVRGLETGYLKRGVEMRTNRLLSTLAGASMDAVIVEDLSLLDTIVEQTAQRNPGVRSIRLLNESRRPLSRWQSPQSEGEVEKTLSFSRGITFEGERFGVLEVEWDITQDLHEIRQHTLILMATVAATLLLTLFTILFWLYRMVLLPLGRIRASLTDLSDPVALEQLEQARNSSEFDQIVDAVQVLSGVKERLEARVAARTSELAEANEKLQTLLRSDTLTGLNNRLAMNERLADEFKRLQRYRVSYSVILFDIDRFKRINDTHGHGAGDQVIRRVAAVLRGSLRQTDFIARLGGDELFALLPSTGLAEAVRLAERVLMVMESTVEADEIPVTLSIGVAQARAEQEDELCAVAEADRYLYRAKRAGRNCVASGLGLFKPDLVTSL